MALGTRETIWRTHYRCADAVQQRRRPLLVCGFASIRRRHVVADSGVSLQDEYEMSTIVQINVDRLANWHRVCESPQKSIGLNDPRVGVRVHCLFKMHDTIAGGICMHSLNRYLLSSSRFVDSHQLASHTLQFVPTLGMNCISTDSRL